LELAEKLGASDLIPTTRLKIAFAALRASDFKLSLSYTRQALIEFKIQNNIILSIGGSYKLSFDQSDVEISIDFIEFKSLI
jgi:hypothetical protein